MKMTIEGSAMEWIQLGKLLQESVRLPVCVVTTEPDLNVLWNSEFEPHPAYADPSELIRSIAANGIDSPYPVLRATPFMEQFILVPVRSSGSNQALIVIGPSIFQHPDEEVAMNLLNDLVVPRRERPGWLRYWRALPVASRMQLLHVGALAHWTANREPIEMTEVLQMNLQDDPRSGAREKTDAAIWSQRESFLLPGSRDYERRMLDCIRGGKPDELMSLLADFSSVKVGVLSKRSQLRNLKNLAICGIAIATRAAVDGGLYEELAYSLSDLHIQHIEELSDSGSVEAALNQAFLDFARRVRETRRQSVSRPVHACQEYIFNHLHEDITPVRLAEIAGLHPGYLSHLFKEETGLTLMNYIQRERIEEAKKLLDHTRDSISEIGLRLGFYDHAHFVKVFKKHAGTTPKQYRDPNRRR